MNRKTFKTWALGAAFALLASNLGAQTVDQILDKAESQPRPPASRADMKLVITNKAGQSRTREIEAWSATAPNGDNKQVLVFKAPADVKDTRFLTLSYDDPGKKDEQYIYIPALRKVRTIGTSGGEDSKTGSFLGTDFTFADLGTLERTDFNVTLEGTDKVDGVDHFRILYTAKNAEVIKTYGYSKVVKWVNAGNYTTRKSEFWDAAGKLVKRSEILGQKQVEGYWQFDKIVMYNLETGGNSTWEFTKNTILPSVEDKYFTLRFLERGR